MFSGRILYEYSNSGLILILYFKSSCSKVLINDGYIYKKSLIPEDKALFQTLTCIFIKDR